MHPWFAEKFFNVHELLLRRRTFSLLCELNASQWWSRAEIEVLQWQRLRELARIAYDGAPYWRETMDANGVTPEDLTALRDLRRLPLLTKDIIRSRREEMVCRNADKRVRLARTSGSTNAALEFYTGAYREASITAARLRGHQWVGVEPGDREMYFWAAPVELYAQDRIKAVRDWLRNDGFDTALNLDAETVRRHLERWRRWRPKCIFGYVSSFTLMARLAEDSGLDLRVLAEGGLKAIVTTSEILGENRSTIESAFGVPVYDSYGIREGGLIGHECDRFTLHTNDEQVLLEVIDPETLEPTDGEGELVVTMLASAAMPVIRYRTGDIVSLVDDPCSCGRSLRSLRISGGRLMEFIVTRTGKWVSAVAFIYVCRKVKGVLQIQARQKKRGEIRVLVAPGPDFPEDGVDQVERSVRARLQDDDIIHIDLVEEIPPAPSGKQRLVISEVATQLLKPNQAR